MKILIFVRHAKSSWESFTATDFERPLNERGQKDAPHMAKRLKKKKIEPDALVSSPAARAMETARYFATVFDYDASRIVEVKRLYEPSIPAFDETISNLDDEWETVLLFSHNPGITEYVNTLTATKVDDMPTCAVVAIKCPCKKWSDFQRTAKEFWFFDYPKAEH